MLSSLLSFVEHEISSFWNRMSSFSQILRDCAWHQLRLLTTTLLQGINAISPKLWQGTLAFIVRLATGNCRVQRQHCNPHYFTSTEQTQQIATIAWWSWSRRPTTHKLHSSMITKPFMNVSWHCMNIVTHPSRWWEKKMLFLHPQRVITILQMAFLSISWTLASVHVMYRVGPLC